jgi:hypothetical protein
MSAVVLIVALVVTATWAGGTSASAASGPPCTKVALKRAVQGKVLNKTCTKGWAAGSMRLRGSPVSAFIVKARTQKGKRTWVALSQLQLTTACGPGSPVPRKVLKRSPCSIR